MTDTVNTDEIVETAETAEITEATAVTGINTAETEKAAVTEAKASDTAVNKTGAPEAVSGKLSPALKKEIRNIFIYVFIGVALLILVFFLINLFVEEPADYAKFDYTVVLGALGGGLVAWGNFFLMGLTVQKVASDTNEERARNRMKLSYTYRYLMQIAWIVIAILVPCFNFITGIIPLLFPTLGIKIAGIIFKKY